MKSFIKIFQILIIPAILISCNNEKPADAVVLKNNPNVILLIGDGMGLSQLSAAFYYGESPSNFTRFKEIGFINTSSSSDTITDSGAGGTAFAIGEKTYNGAIGVVSDSTSVPNIVEILSKDGYNTGVIATSSVTHATPAGFYAHVTNRGMQDEIARTISRIRYRFLCGRWHFVFQQQKGQP